MFVIARLDLAWKVLASSFLIVLSCGFFVAHLYLHKMVGGAAGKGEALFPTLEDVTVHFHGREGESRMKTMTLGSMKKYFSSTEKIADLTPADQADIDTVVKWCEKGAPEAEYWDKEKKAGPILKILGDHGCVDCHTAEAKMKGNKKDSPLDTFQDISRFTKQSGGMDSAHLLSLSHIHLLGMGLMFFGAGLFMAATRYGAKLRSLMIFGGFLSVLMDIGGWWAVKWWGAIAAPLTVAGGTLMGASFGVIVLLVLRDIWLVKDDISEREGS